jgi:glycosyltransferase involved in cell wall biosynthesis
VIAGPDEGMLGELRRIAEAANASEQVRFIGYVGGSEKLQAYKAADLLVIPSRQESMSIVVLEAGRAGTPVLITDQCYFDIVETAGGGKVVGATVKQLAEGLVELLGDEPRLARMSTKIGELTRNTFDWNVIIKRYLTLYEQVLRDHAVQ